MPIIPFNSDDLQPFAFVQEGKCSLETKAINAYRSGAKVLVVISSDPKSLSKPRLAVSSINAAQVTTLMVRKDTGDALIAALTNKDQRISKTVILSYRNREEKSSVADIHVVLSPDQQAAYQVLADFDPMAKALGPQLQSSFYFMLFSCKDCEKQFVASQCLD